MEYIIVTAEFPDGIQALARLVQEKISEGYQPIGGVTVWKEGVGRHCFAQTMIKV